MFYENISPNKSEVFYQTKNIHFVFISRFFRFVISYKEFFFSRFTFTVLFQRRL